MLSKEVLGQIRTLFHDMSQPLNYMQVIIEIAEPETGIQGQDLIELKAAVEELTASFRQARNLVNNSQQSNGYYGR